MGEVDTGRSYQLKNHRLHMGNEEKDLLEQVKYGNKRQDRMHMKGNRHMV